MANEAVDQPHAELTLDHLAIQKLIFLHQEMQSMQLTTGFLQQAAEPYIHKIARSIDNQPSDKKWFEYRKSELHKYQPLDDAGSHRTDFEKYFVNSLSEMPRSIIDLYRKVRSEEMVAVPPLYVYWEGLLKSSREIFNELLTSKFFAWSEQKSRFPVAKPEKAIEWIKQNWIVPAREVS